MKDRSSEVRILVKTVITLKNLKRAPGALFKFLGQFIYAGTSYDSGSAKCYSTLHVQWFSY